MINYEYYKHKVITLNDDGATNSNFVAFLSSFAIHQPCYYCLN